MAEVTHHLVLVLAKVPRQLPPQPGDGLQAHLVPAAKGVNSQGEEGDGFGAAPRLVLTFEQINKLTKLQPRYFVIFFFSYF